MDDHALKRFFANTPSLAQLCTQNSWPDPGSLRVDVLERNGDQILCSVEFEEIVMKGAGCVARRKPCWGRFHVRIDSRGNVVDARLVAGVPDPH
ncbi:MAG: hypothetical protein ACE5LB_01440 [Acidiferrobacterales bacterium]